MGFIDKVEDSETLPGSTCSLVLIVTETEGGREWGVNEDVMRQKCGKRIVERVDVLDKVYSLKLCPNHS